MKYPFTPGPWEVDSGMVQTVAEHKCKTENCGVHIPICYMDRTPDNGTEPCERDSNAHLIACAPELVDALRGALFFVPLGTLARQRADALLNRIAKQTE